MNRKSIYLIVLGIVLVISGVFVEVVTFTEKNKKETYRSLQKQMDFRQVVSDKFSDKYFTFEKVKIENASII
jgi:Na+-translocating ferredoxin:NAD+ oxidoreductase RnfG subunit